MLSPVVVLLVAQLATTYWRGVAVLGVALAISVLTLDRMESYLSEFLLSRRRLPATSAR